MEINKVHYRVNNTAAKRKRHSPGKIFPVRDNRGSGSNRLIWMNEQPKDIVKDEKPIKRILKLGPMRGGITADERNPSKRKTVARPGARRNAESVEFFFCPVAPVFLN